MHCDTVISPEPTGITAVITIRYWLRCFGDRNQKRNLQPRLMVFSRFLIALVMRSALLMVGVGRVWWRNVKVSVRRTAPVSVTALMQR